MELLGNDINNNTISLKHRLVTLIIWLRLKYIRISLALL